MVGRANVVRRMNRGCGLGVCCLVHVAVFVAASVLLLLVVMVPVALESFFAPTMLACLHTLVRGSCCTADAGRVLQRRDFFGRARAGAEGVDGVVQLRTSRRV